MTRTGVMIHTSLRIASSVALAWLGMAALMGGCAVQDVDFTGKTCVAASDCPSLYSCVAASQASCPVGSQSCCQPAGEATPFYCSDAKPILDAYCLFSCHGEIHTDSGQTTFRLDYYDPPVDGGLPGAREKAERIKARAADQKNMPPVGVAAPTDSQRATLGRWVAAGALFCADAGTP